MTGDKPTGGVEPGPDRLEIWAKRTGRTLGYVVLALLAIYLVSAYIVR